MDYKHMTYSELVSQTMLGDDHLAKELVRKFEKIEDELLSSIKELRTQESEQYNNGWDDAIYEMGEKLEELGNG